MFKWSILVVVAALTFHSSASGYPHKHHESIQLPSGPIDFNKPPLSEDEHDALAKMVTAELQKNPSADDIARIVTYYIWKNPSLIPEDERVDDVTADKYYERSKASLEKTLTEEGLKIFASEFIKAVNDKHPKFNENDKNDYDISSQNSRQFRRQTDPEIDQTIDVDELSASEEVENKYSKNVENNKIEESDKSPIELTKEEFEELAEEVKAALRKDPSPAEFIEIAMEYLQENPLVFETIKEYYKQSYGVDSLTTDDFQKMLELSLKRDPSSFPKTIEMFINDINEKLADYERKAKDENLENNNEKESESLELEEILGSR